ncbi:MAG: hypothetical protein D6715_14555 [Calditrichaeota bacterium]|nr:MAG: hypothetical protein D6715_14555 [Calditrichota bacterium]
MRSLLLALVPYALMGVVKHGLRPSAALAGSEGVMAAGFILLAAYLVGRIVGQRRLPKITGYLLAGIACGPYFLNLLSREVVAGLQLIDGIALSFIALTAGGEFVVARVRRQWRLISAIIVGKTVVVLLGVCALVVVIYPWVPFLHQLNLEAALGVGLILGVLSVAKSPATTIAVITETRARGPLTELLLSVTVAKDILVILIFAFVLGIAEPLIHPEQGVQLVHLVLVLRDMFFSILVGAGVGLLIYGYLRLVREQVFLFLMGLVLLLVEMSHLFHLETILVFLSAGFVVQNFSSEGGRLIATIEENSLPIYVLFFCIAGASLDFGIFLQNWWFTLVLVAARLATTWGGTALGTRLVPASESIRRYAWKGFIGQAGVTLGLAIIVQQSIGGALGLSIKNVIVAAIIVNQLLGPVLLHRALVQGREIPSPAAS